MSGPVPPSEVPLRTVALRLSPLLQPHRSKGRLALRIERVPQLARLSRGRNNGDGSWSLASDELDGLEYMTPAGADLPRLMVRIIGLEQDGATLAVHEYSVSDDDDDSESSGDAGTDDAYFQRLSAELKTAKATLAARENELAELRRSAPTGNKDDLAAVRAAWDAEMEKRLTDAAAGAAQSAERQARQWQQAEAERLASAEAKWTEATVQAATLARAQADAQAATALAAAEARWRAGEAERLAAAEKQWREESASAPRDPRSALSPEGEEALQAARSQLTQAQKELIQYEDDLRRAQHAIEAMKEAAPKEQAAALERAEAAWKRGEGERIAAAEAGWKRAEDDRISAAEALWRSKAAADLAVLTARCESAERALAAGADGQAARDAELSRMREERATLQAKFTEAERAQTAAASDSARKLVETALAEARMAWQAEEAARQVAAENTWRADAKVSSDAALSRLREEHAAVQARQAESARAQSAAAGDAVRQQIETALAAAKGAWKSEESGRLALAETTWRAEAKAAHEIELNRLRNENAALQGRIADQERVSAAGSGDASRQQIETVLADARAAWKAEEAARLAAAEAGSRAKAATEIAALTARCESAEKAAARGTPGQDDAERKRLEAECASLRARLSEAERAGAAPETDAARADARAAWKAEEAARLAQAEEKWRVESAAALARANQRADAAEAALARARAGEGGGGYDQAFIDGLRDEIGSLRRGLADREIELAQARLTLEARHIIPDSSHTPSSPQTRITLERTPRDREIEHEPADPARNRKLIRDIGVVFGAVVALLLIFPYIVPYLPYEWQLGIYDFETSIGLADAPTAPDTPPPAPVKRAPAPQPPPAIPTLSVLKAVNVRKDSDAGAAVVTRLKQGDAVVVVETRGNWTHVKTDGGEGWVYSSYLGKASP
jgi:hypothetical protein